MPEYPRTKIVTATFSTTDQYTGDIYLVNGGELRIIGAFVGSIAYQEFWNGAWRTIQSFTESDLSSDDVIAKTIILRSESGILARLFATLITSGTPLVGLRR